MGGELSCRVISILKGLLSSLDQEPGIRDSKLFPPSPSKARGKVLLSCHDNIYLLPPI